jgi:signal transduction histidine kinase/PAS domain-containing protein
MTIEPDYAALFQASPYPYLLIAPDLTLVGANRAYLEATATSRERILGEHIFDAFPADPADPSSTNLAEVKRSIEMAIATGKPHTSPLLRYAVPVPGGGFAPRFWSAVHTPVMDAAGELAFIAQTPIDVTDLYRFDAPTSRYVLKPTLDAVTGVVERSGPQLHEALTRILDAERTRLQALFDQAPGFIALLHGPDHVFGMANEAFYRLVGRRGLIGKTVWQALPDIAGQGIEGALAQAYRSGRPVVLNKLALRVGDAAGGALSERHVDLVMQPVVDGDGRVSGIFAQGHDVTAAHLASVALQDKVRELEAVKARQAMLLELGDLLRSLSDDPQAMMAAASKAVATFLGLPRAGYVAFEPHSRQTLVVHAYNDLARVPPLPEVVEEPDEFGQAVMNELRAGRPIVIHDMDTDPRTVGAVAQAHAALGARAALAVPIRRQGRAVAFMLAHDDRPRQWSDAEMELMVQTADRTWEAVERAQALLALRDTDRRKDEFLAMLAHELRNPLAPIGAAAQLLQLAQPDAARVRRTSEVIGRQVQHMTGLIDDLLDVSRVTRGLISLEPVRLDMKDVVADAVEQVQPLMAARRHDLVLRLAPQAALVNGDRKRLVQVVVNVLNNAAKYTHEGGCIVLDSRVTAEHVIVEVADNGIGMTAELVKRVFDLFAQAERTSDRASGGLGLGLALVKSLVELHGGAVTCSSGGLGKGSTFRLCLPRLRDAEPDGFRSDADAGAPALPGARRILIVDDNVDAAAMLAMLLETHGHEVLGDQARLAGLRRARAERPSVCLLDIGLPDMDGNELARRLRAAPETRAAVLIAVTGYGQQNDRDDTAAAGFDHHLVKPVDMNVLAAILAGLDSD